MVTGTFDASASGRDGEMGLDYYWKDSTPEEQDKVFRRQIAIAKEMKLPIVIHNRDATEDCYKILKEEGIQDIGAIMHSYNGDVEFMKRFLGLRYAYFL